MARKVVGGVAYPYRDKPGYAVVVAVDYDAKDPKKKPTYKVLAEAESMNVATLFEECLRLQGQHEPEPGTDQYWFGDSMNLPMMSIWMKVISGKRFLFIPPPHFGEPSATGFFLQAINTKDLLFRKDSKLPGYLLEVLPKDIVGISEYPPLAALGYVMGTLYEEWLQLEYEKKPKTGPQRIIEEVERGPWREGDDLPWRRLQDSAEVAGYNPRPGGFFDEEW